MIPLFFVIHPNHRSLLMVHTSTDFIAMSVTQALHVATPLIDIKCKGRVEKHYCQLCDKAYLSKYKLKDHVLVKHEGQTVSCPDCGKRFSSRSSMEMHKKQQHEGQFSIFCKICSKGFNHTGHYYGHMNKHTNTKPFWCQQCGKRFYGSSYLHNHKQVCRSNADFNYACDQCDRKFKCELYLKKHKKVHEATPIIYQAQGGMQVESDEDVDIMDIMQVCEGKANMGDDNLVINESDEDDMLVIDSSATSPQSAAYQLPLDGDPNHRNNAVLNEDNLPAALASVASPEWRKHYSIIDQMHICCCCWRF